MFGNGTSKVIQIDLNTTKGFKTGGFNSQSILANINFIVEEIRFYTESELDFELSIYKDELIPNN